MAETDVLPAEKEEQRDLIERRISEAGLRPYQAMVVRNVYADENLAAALSFIAAVRDERVDAKELARNRVAREVGDGATAE